jgi:hypothetical protein
VLQSTYSSMSRSMVKQTSYKQINRGAIRFEIVRLTGRY